MSTELRQGAFYWINIIANDTQEGLFSDSWQPARYTGRAGDTIGDTWDFLGRLSADGHHFVEVVKVGREIRFEPESDASYYARLMNRKGDMNYLDRFAILTSSGEGLDTIGSHIKMPRLI